LICLARKECVADSSDEKDNSEIESAIEATSELETCELIISDPSAIEVDLNHGKISKLENLDCLTQVEGLYMRWNLIKKIENLQTLVTLRELELYDNQLTKIENLDALVNLE